MARGSFVLTKLDSPSTEFYYMMKYNFYVTTSQSGGEGKFDIQTDVGTYRQTNFYRTDRQTYGNRDQKSNRIGI